MNYKSKTADINTLQPDLLYLAMDICAMNIIGESESEMLCTLEMEVDGKILKGRTYTDRSTNQSFISIFPHMCFVTEDEDIKYRTISCIITDLDGIHSVSSVNLDIVTSN